MPHPDWFRDVSRLGELPNSSRVVTAGIITAKMVSMTRGGGLLVRFALNSYGAEVGCTVEDGDPDNPIIYTGSEVIVQGVVDWQGGKPTLIVDNADVKRVGNDGVQYAEVSTTA